MQMKCNNRCASVNAICIHVGVLLVGFPWRTQHWYDVCIIVTSGMHFKRWAVHINILSYIWSLLIFGIFVLRSPMCLCNIFYLIISNLRNKYEIPNKCPNPIVLVSALFHPSSIFSLSFITKCIDVSSRYFILIVIIDKLNHISSYKYTYHVKFNLTQFNSSFHVYVYLSNYEFMVEYVWWFSFCSYPSWGWTIYYPYTSHVSLLSYICKPIIPFLVLHYPHFTLHHYPSPLFDWCNGRCICCSILCTTGSRVQVLCTVLD